MPGTRATGRAASVGRRDRCPNTRTSRTTASTRGSRRRASTGAPMQVGPLANVLVGLRARAQPLDEAMDRPGAADGGSIAAPTASPATTCTRRWAVTLARAIRCGHAGRPRRASTGSSSSTTSASGDTDHLQRAAVFPKGEMRGVGFHEAPRGTLSHWVVIENGMIKNYQAVVPTDVEREPARRARHAGPVRGLAARESGRRHRQAARGAAHRALVRPVHGLRVSHPRRRGPDRRAR